MDTATQADGGASCRSGRWAGRAAGNPVLEVFTDGRHVLELEEDLSGCANISDGVRSRFSEDSDLGELIYRLLPQSFAKAMQP